MNNLPPLKKGFVISDLHLFTHRTMAEVYMDEIRHAASQADFFVLNGDIFDFRWTNLASMEHTAHAAIDWLETFCTDFPHCRLFYIMGNHDGLKFFADCLGDLADRQENFRWHASHFRLGNSLFLHGDLPLTIRKKDPFQRTLLPIRRTKGRAMNLGYHIVITTRIHRYITWIHGPRWCARRILKSLEYYHPELAAGIEHIYYGHIHKTFSNLRYRGVTFHNTGSAIQGLKCRLLSAQT
jgi:UDP-2,3-diacylglucosamine hydrolase